MNLSDKKVYSRPLMSMERFIPQSYCDACFTYQATLHCVYGQWHKNHHFTNVNATIPGNGCVGIEDHGLHHGAACANSYLTVTVTKGVVTYAGHEDGDKEDVPLESVYIPNVENLHQGDIIESPTAHWGSSDGHNGYYHKGGGVVTSWSMSWPGHPAHS